MKVLEPLEQVCVFVTIRADECQLLRLGLGGKNLHGRVNRLQVDGGRVCSVTETWRTKSVQSETALCQIIRHELMPSEDSDRSL